MLRLAVAFALVVGIQGFSFPNRCLLKNLEPAADPHYCYSGVAVCPYGLSNGDPVCTGSDKCCRGFVCDSVTCENDGVCVDDGSGVPYCNCTGEFTGDNCEIASCDPACVNGDCVASVCECNDGYNGTDCSIDVCSDENSQCVANNTNACVRVAPPALFECDCMDGFDGDLCETDVCAPENSACDAANTNECVRLAAPDLFECDCLDGYHGDLCETDACDPAADPCVNGNCTRTGSAPYYDCVCEEPFFGDNCDQEICDTSPCENMGTCESLSENTYECTCTDDWTGDNCTVPVCAGDDSECSFNGTCMPIGGGEYECDCFTGFYGDACQFEEPLCGVEVASRIAFGQDASESEHPWMAAFADSTGFIICSGTLIGRKYVLTSLSCGLLIEEETGTVDVLLGQHNATGTDIDEQVYQIADTIFMDTTYANLAAYEAARGVDINNGLADALVVVELNGNVTYGYGVNRPCTPEQNTFDSNSNCKVGGWGLVSASGDQLPTVKQTEDTSLVNSDLFCGYMLETGLSVPSNVACSLLETETASGCLIDQGGPVVCQDPTTYQWHLQGIMLYYPIPLPDTFCGDQLVPYVDLYTAWNFVETNTGISLA